MAMCVHLADERDAKSICRNGLRGAACTVLVYGDRLALRRAVFLFPMLQSYTVTHQWLRELKRNGMRTMVAVSVRLRTDCMVFVGRYNGEHRRVPLGHAIQIIMKEPDPRGWQIIVPHAIDRGSIHEVRATPQVVGWRYFPESHEKGPWKCLCDYCWSGTKGGIKVQRLRKALLRKYGAENLNAADPADAVEVEGGD